MSSRVVASKARPVAAGKTGDHEGTALATISIVTGCYNEEDNVAELAARVRAVLESLPGYEYEHIFIDNASKDGTVDELRKLAAADPSGAAAKLIVAEPGVGYRIVAE